MATAVYAIKTPAAENATTATAPFQAKGDGTTVATKNQATTELQIREFFEAGLSVIFVIAVIVNPVAPANKRIGNACTIAPVTVWLIPWADRNESAVGAERPLIAISRVKR